MPIIRQIPRPGHPIRWQPLAIILFVILLFFWQFAALIADWLWFKEVGYATVFSVRLIAQMQAGVLFALCFFCILAANLLLAVRLSGRPEDFIQGNVIRISVPALDHTRLKQFILLISLVCSVFAGMYGASQWENLLRFFNGASFRLSDPLFSRDIAFYVFQLPLLQQIQGLAMTLLILTFLATAILYLLRGAFTFLPPATFHSTANAQRHLFILIAVIFFTASFGYWLDLSDLLVVKRGVVTGAGYTDVTTQVWVLYLIAGLGVLAGLSFIALIFRRDWRVPALIVLVFLVVLFVGRGAYPEFVQKFKVVPNEIVLEKPYLERNIRYTRLAYGLDKIEDREFPAQENLTLKDIERNNPTIKNIRLWDYAPLLQTYSQLQEIRTYYKFLGVDNDRYTINGEYRQIMLAPRELSYAALPSRTWVNEHLTYTHGYGAVMSPVNRISREGLPEFLIKDIPPVPSTAIRISRPEIYYSETATDYIFVRTKRLEFDYPVGDKNVYSRYEGTGGVPLSFLKKLLFAVRFQSLTVLLSDDITAGSRIMYYRSIKERVSRLVPFVTLDPDPYLVVSPEGRLLWFIDGYTTTGRFPYSEPTPGIGNYIRNSLKAVVDAYDGSVQLYISDPGDPIIQTYARIFPGIFKKMEEMPSELRSHVRYPPGMLSLQARMYRTYHMQDPQVFYNKEDLWTIPQATTGEGEREMRPYYTIMKLPGEGKEEYILLLPFTPSKKDNMSAWMAARCDAPNYGRLIVYNFPKQRLVYGPRQIVARINQDPVISAQLSLWSQRGSQVIPGSLMAIPIEKSILYVQSLYLAAEKGQLPELKRVIVAYGNRIVMEENLETALQRVFGGELMRDRTAAFAGAEPEADVGIKSGRKQAAEALSHYRKAQEFLRQGDWAGFGAELKKVEGILRSLEKAAP
ncbi:MAG: UPF0182 family protein [Deltaproteobacteria bacterium]|nr:UPF0182 family protein [Deltaproteobacteria bacterium]